MSLEGIDSWNLAVERELRAIAKLLLETKDTHVNARIEHEATAKTLLRKGFRIFQTEQSISFRPFLIVCHDWAPGADWMLKDRWPVVMEKDTLVGFRKPAAPKCNDN